MRTVTTKLSILFINIILMSLIFAIVRQLSGIEVAKAVTSLTSLISFSVIAVKVFKLNDGSANNAINR